MSKRESRKTTYGFCPVCGGNGQVVCPKCKGTGKSTEGTCHNCGGTGIERCSYCRGSGVVIEKIRE